MMNPLIRFYLQLSGSYRIEFFSALFLLGPILFTACGSGGSRSANTAKPTAKVIVGPLNYVALGDSTGAGVGASDGGYVARLFKRTLAFQPESKLTNLCVSGATTEDVLREQLGVATRLKPNFVTVGVGINDISHGVDIELFSQNYSQILERLISESDAAIVVINIPDVSSAPRIPSPFRSEYHDHIVRFNQKLAEIAARHPVTVFDLYSVTHEQLSRHPEFFSGDGFHPSDKGYESWAEQMWPTVAGAIGLDRN
jgi:lysophospholipase L1-like esterase